MLKPTARVGGAQRPGLTFRSHLLLLALLLIAGSVAPLSADTSVRFIEVTAAQDWVLSGSTLQLEARALNSFGARLSDIALQWKSSDSSVAEVDGAGLVRGLMPGRTEIHVSHSGVSESFTVSVHPARIEIEPRRPELFVGEQITLTARAFDAEGRAISGLGFLWFSGLAGVASLSPQGVVQALAEGSTTVTAYLNVPALGFGFSTQTLVRVRRRPAFTIDRLITNEFETLAAITTIEEISYAGDDRIAFRAMLSNGSQALMLYDNGVLRTLAVTGQYLNAVGAGIDSFAYGQVSINQQGDVLAPFFFFTHPWAALLFPGADPDSEPRIIPAPSGYCCLETDFHALGADGEMAFVAHNEMGKNVFFRGQDGSLQLIATQNDLPDFGSADWVRAAAIYRPGEVVFAANRSDSQGYFHWDGRQLRKIYATGDSVLDRRVHGGRVPIQTASGDFYALMYGEGFSQIVRLSGDSWSKVIRSGERVDGFDIHGLHELFDARDGAVLFGADTGQGSGVFRLEDGRLDFVARYGDSVADREWQWISHAFLRPQGGVIVSGNQGATLWRVARVDDSSDTTLVQSGQSLNEPAPTSLTWRNLVVGGTAGNRVFVSSSGALVRVGNESLETVLAPGQILPGESVLGSIRARASNLRGDIAFGADTDRGPGLYQWRDGSAVVVVGPGTAVKAPDGSEFHWFDGPTAVNDRGETAAWTGFDGGQALLLYSPGASVAESLMTFGQTAPGGGNFEFAHQVAIDGDGRVVFDAQLSGGSNALFLWENGQARKILQIGDQGPRGEVVTQFRGELRASADEFYRVLAYGEFGETQEIAAYDGNRWRSVVATGEQTTFGSFIHYFEGNRFAVSATGDVAYLAGLPAEQAVILRSREGRDTVVATTRERSPQGDWLLGFSDVHITQQGEVLFTAVSATTLRERIGVYVAIRD